MRRLLAVVLSASLMLGNSMTAFAQNSTYSNAVVGEEISLAATDEITDEAEAASTTVEETETKVEEETKEETKAEEEGKTEEETKTEEERKTEEETKAEEEGKTEEETKAEEESKTEEETKAEEESKTEEETKAEEESKTEEETKAEEETKEETETEVEEETKEETETEVEEEIKEETETEVENKTEEETVEAERVNEEIVSANSTTVTNEITYKDSQGKYELTIAVTDDLVIKYGTITKFKDLTQSETYAITIPATVDYDGADVEVTTIGADAFKGNLNVKAVFFEEDSKLTGIERRAFQGCTSLAYVDFPSTVTKIDKDAFKNCANLGTENSKGEKLEMAEIFLPQNLTTLGELAFADCTNFEKVKIPKSLTTMIGDHTITSPFRGCDSLTTIILEEGMTKVPSGLFNGDEGVINSLKIDITIPDSVTTIGGGAFWKQENLVNVFLGENTQLTNVGRCAFEYCTSLNYFGIKTDEGEIIETPGIYLPDGLTTLGEFAFSYCKLVEKLVLPKSLISIVGEHDVTSPFRGCDNLTAIVLEEGMTKVPNNLFDATDGIINSGEKGITVVIPDSVTTIGEYAFLGQTNIVEVSLGKDSKLTSIERAAFKGCVSLTYFDFPSAVTHIYKEAFRNCTNLGTKTSTGETLKTPEIFLPKNLTTLGEFAFSGCTLVEKVEIPKSLTDIVTNSGDNNITSPFSSCDNLTTIILEDGMTKIPNNLFDGTDGRIASEEKEIRIAIPDSVTTIGEYAFLGQTNIVDITFGENSKLTSIERAAFKGCSSLTYFDFPSKVSYIYKEAFRDCTNLGTRNSKGEILKTAEIFLPDKLTTFGEDAFSGCTEVEKIVIPNTLKYNVTNAGDNTVTGVFTGCSKLTQIVLEEGLSSIPQGLFYGAIVSTEASAVSQNSISIDIPDSVVTIEGNAFRDQVNATAIRFGENSSLTSIAANAFNNCSSLTSMDIPNEVTSIADNAFVGCTKLETINLPEKLISIGKTCFKNCTSLKNVTIPDTVTSIGNYAFQDCTGLEWAEFEINNLYTAEQKLGTGVFRNCKSLTTMKFGNKIKNIPNETFYDCSELLEVEFPYGTTTIGKDVFYNCKSLKALFIPSSVSKISIAASELAYCYEQDLKIYVEKRDSVAKTFATNNGWETEVGIYATEDEFPDKALLSQMLTQFYDKNLDTRLTLRELEQIVSVNLSNLGIQDMTGTQLFTSMESLDCSSNEITSLNVDEWKQLKTLDCSDNKLTVCDVSKIPLEILDCSNNSILIPDFGNVKTLKKLTIGVQNGTMAVVENETYGLYTLPLPGTYPAYDEKRVSEVSDEDIMKTNRDGIRWEEAYDVPDKVSFHYTSSYGSGADTAQAVIHVVIPNAGIVLTNKEYPDLDFRMKISEILDTNQNGLISKNEERDCIKLDVSGTEGYKIRELTGVERLVNLRELICKNNELPILDISQNSELTMLDCSNNLLTTLSIKNNPKLVSVRCSNNKIKELDTLSNVSLKQIVCDNNKIATLSISSNTLLEDLECGNNRLTALDISANKNLSNVLLGNQTATLLREVQDELSYVKVREYDKAFCSDFVKDVVSYEGETADASGEFTQLTEEGFVTKSSVDKISYKYKLTGFGNLNVTLQLVDELPKEEDVILKNIADLNIDEFASKVYTGEATFQNIVIFDADEQYMLRENIDYEAKYYNNIEVGTAKVEIKGIGNYYGSYEATYEIIGEWDISIKTIKDQIFQNKEIKPVFVVKYERKTLREGFDYTTEYINNVNTGVATIIITGKNNYKDCGIKEVTFNIVECKITQPSFKIDNVTYNGSVQKPKVTGIYKGVSLEEGRDYEVVYGNNIKAGKGTLTIVGIGNYTGTVKKTFTIGKIDLKKLASHEVTVSENVCYNMAGAKADVSIKSGGYQLKEGVDYTLSYSKNKTIGTGKVVIKGKGSCTNKIERTFEIKAQNIADSSIKIDVAVAQVKSNGKALKPKVTITQGKKKLREGEKKDYVIEYDENATTAPGSYLVKIYGKNNYAGSEKAVEKEFIIVNQLINKAKVKGLQNFEYDGSEKEQFEEMLEVTVGGKEVDSAFYEVTYENNLNAGNAKIIITANPTTCAYEFGGTASAKFKIAPIKFKVSKDEKRVGLELLSEEYTYTGNKLTPTVLVYDTEKGIQLTENEDYIVTYKNNVKVGTGSVTIKGTNNYIGTDSCRFSVVQKNMFEHTDDFKVIVKNSSYTGKVIKPRISVKDGDITLKENKDYVLHVEQYIETDDFDGKIKEKGKYIITIEGKGNYTGEINDLYYLSVY